MCFYRLTSEVDVFVGGWRANQKHSHLLTWRTMSTVGQTMRDRNMHMLSSSLPILDRRIQYFTWSCCFPAAIFPPSALPARWNSRNDWGKLCHNWARLSVGLNQHFSLSWYACRVHCLISACLLESTVVMLLWSLPQSPSPPCISSAC